MELLAKTIRVREMIKFLVERVIAPPKWNFPQSYAVGAYLQNGINELPKLYGISDIDDERIIDFILYQIYRCRNSIEEGKWQYTWIFSGPAKEKFKKQFLNEDGKSGMNYYIDQWLDEAELTRKKLVDRIADPKPNKLRQMVYLPSEEPIKRRFLNNDMGLALCQQSTTGWSPLSPTCEKCNNWIECGKLTAKKYPELIRFRKEAYHGRKEK